MQGLTMVRNDNCLGRPPIGSFAVFIKPENSKITIAVHPCPKDGSTSVPSSLPLVAIYGTHRAPEYVLGRSETWLLSASILDMLFCFSRMDPPGTSIDSTLRPVLSDLKSLEIAAWFRSSKHPLINA